MKMIYAEDDDYVRQKVILQLETKFTTKIVQLPTQEMALQYIKANDDIDIILSDYTFNDGKADKIYKLVREKYPKVPVVWVTERSLNGIMGDTTMKSFKNDHPKNGYIQIPCETSDLVEGVGKALGKNLTLRPDDFCRIDINRFLTQNSIACNVYLKLSERKYVKVINENDLYSKSLVDHYVNKGIESFYTSTKEFDRVNSTFVQNLLTELSQGKSDTTRKRDVELAGAAYTQELVSQGFVDEKTVEVMNKTVDSAVGYVQKDPNLYKLLKKMLKKNDYMSQHSMLISYISAAIAMRMGWDSSSTLQKLSMAALLHDIHLQEPELAMVQDITEAEENKLDQDQIKIIKGHPSAGMTSVRAMKNLPPDVDTVIHCHHENPEGTGFPRTMSALKISPLACIFIIAEDFVNRIFKDPKNALGADSMVKIKDEFQQRYDKGNYRKPLQGFMILFSEFEKNKM